ncbi:MAG: hypothetical protein ACOX4I_07035 [Anaerovoracaceae bacterium]|jgi:hypothetical protein
MAKKKVRNKARDAIGDYWKTNRETEQANEKAGGGRKSGLAGWTIQEKVMLIVIILGAIGLVIKYVVLR